MSRESFSEIEHEIIILYAVWDMIDEMVNFDMFEKLSTYTETNLMFKTSTHTRLFNVLLSDFLSAPPLDRTRRTLPFGLPKIPKNDQPSNQCFLHYLERITQRPLFTGSISPLREVVTEFKQWLDTECTVNDVWLSDISVNVDVRASRFSLLKICGNIGKHNFSRLEANVNEIRGILDRSGKKVDEQQAFIALPNFYDWFHRDFFVYHSSTVAEYLNNIRWATYRYLQPEFARSFSPPRSDDPSYSFSYPSGCQQPLARGMYWGLMNHMYRKPYFPEFSVTQSLKSQY